MEITGKRNTETFVPFSITLTFNSETEVQETLASMKSDEITGSSDYSINHIPTHLHRHARIYYAIKSRGK